MNKNMIDNGIDFDFGKTSKEYAPSLWKACINVLHIGKTIYPINNQNNILYKIKESMFLIVHL